MYKYNVTMYRVFNKILRVNVFASRWLQSPWARLGQEEAPGASMLGMQERGVERVQEMLPITSSSSSNPRRYCRYRRRHHHHGRRRHHRHRLTKGPRERSCVCLHLGLARGEGVMGFTFGRGSPMGEGVMDNLPARTSRTRHRPQWPRWSQRHRSPTQLQPRQRGGRRVICVG